MRAGFASGSARSSAATVDGPRVIASRYIRLSRSRQARSQGQAARSDSHATSFWSSPRITLANRTMIEAFTASRSTLMTPIPSPLEPERLPKHVRYLCATPRWVESSAPARGRSAAHDPSVYLRSGRTLPCLESDRIRPFTSPDTGGIRAGERHDRVGGIPQSESSVLAATAISLAKKVTARWASPTRTNSFVPWNPLRPSSLRTKGENRYTSPAVPQEEPRVGFSRQDIGRDDRLREHLSYDACQCLPRLRLDARERTWLLEGVRKHLDLDVAADDVLDVVDDRRCRVAGDDTDVDDDRG